MRDVFLFVLIYFNLIIIMLDDNLYPILDLHATGFFFQIIRNMNDDGDDIQ
ncbi:MAG: hypothetical protein ACI90V_005252 [Bacillariaceae sp.]|jgi:hypothetical protein